MDKILIKDHKVELDLWPWDLKSLSRNIHCTKFGNDLRHHKVLSGQHLGQNKFELDLWPCDLHLKIQREHLLFGVTTVHTCACTKFGNVKKILGKKQLVYGLTSWTTDQWTDWPTNQQVQNKTLLFLVGSLTKR